MSAIADAGIAVPILSVIEALRFKNRSPGRIKTLAQTHWATLLPWCDQRQITLMLPHFCADSLPGDVRKQIAGKQSDFERRLERLKGQLARISHVLRQREIPFVVLKGFTHSPALTPDPVWRAQGDIDLWFDTEGVVDAYNALQEIGYRPGPSHSRRHLPPLVPPDAWQWNGNLADIPIGIELHHRLWCSETESIPLPDPEPIWKRRTRRSFDDQDYDVLATPDLLGFAALHFFLHLIHGDLPLQRIWEIANFLHSRSTDERFWLQWDRWHSSELKRIETIVFRIAEAWFDCDTPSCLTAMSEDLPDSVHRWLDHFPFSPLQSQLDSNKNYLWLHLGLISGLVSQCRVVTRSFFPAKLPAFVDRINETGSASVLGSLVRHREYPLSRAKRYVQSIRPTAFGGVRWFAKCAGFKTGLGSFLLASALFDIGEFLFVLLYNLYLLDLGFREDVLGLITASMTAGTLVGTLLAPLLERRAGVRGLLIVASVGGALATLLRILSVGKTALLVTAALNGVFFAFWAVAFAPMIAGLTSPKNRSVAFGLVTAMGMSIGILVGMVGLRIPGLLTATWGLSAANGKEACMIFGSCLVLLAAIPAMRLRIPRREVKSKDAYPGGTFVRRFTVALFLWIAATSSFNGFGTAYLARHLHLQLQKIGTVFSGGQALQVTAILCGPLLISRLGEKRYVFVTSLGTASMLLALAMCPVQLGLPLYLSYMTLQYMNEPSLFGLLMNHVPEHHRTGASSLMFLTMSIAGALGAAMAGRAIAKFDYPFCLTVAALVAFAAAVVFSFLPDENYVLARRLQNLNNNVLNTD